MRRDLHSLVGRIESNKRILEGKLNALARDVSKPDAELYEVTQLLNSLMGIAVLPYEMHKDYFKKIIDEDKRSVQNWGRTHSEIQDSIKAEPEYKQLQEYILELHDEGKWITTYTKELVDNQIKKDVVVFAFLRHLRNAVCHSGDNAISILPLTEGRVIEEVLFYDSYDYVSNQKKKDNKIGCEEFAMRLSVKELRLLVEKVAMFYSDTSIGEIDKTKLINEVENKIKKLLIRV